MRSDGDLASLAEVCAQLNFRNSLVEDATTLRESVVAALARTADALQDLAAGLGVRAGLCRPGVERDRVLRTATRIRRRAESARSHAADLAATPIGLPRPAAPAAPDAVSS